MKPAAIGVDLVDVASFGEQLGQEGSVFHQVFTAREWNAAARFTPEQGAPASEASEGLSTSHASSGLSVRSMSVRSIQSLAARWAAKEAFIKAWSSLYYGREDPLERDQVNWAEIEVVNDRWGRPSLRFHGAIATALKQTEREISASLTWLVSLSHDGNYAIAWIHAYPSESHSSKDFS